jgi:protein-disulfide isomerase
MMMIRTGVAMAALALGALAAPAQEDPAKPAPKGKMTMQVKSMAEHGQGQTKLPTVETVEAFLRRMFGYEPGLKWRIVDISASTIPNVAHVVVVIGEQGGVSHLYITPDGENAIVGDAVPFGADPFAAARARLAREAKGPSRGRADATVTLVEFSDLQCPYCKASQPVIDRVLKEHPNVRLVFQPFPLSIHPWARKAAGFAQCVAEQSPEGFWKFVQSVYDQQETIKEAEAEARFRALTTAAGADAAKASACAATPLTDARIRQSEELGRALGVTGTPTVFLNGRKISAIREMPYETLVKMIEYESQAAQGK